MKRHKRKNISLELDVDKWISCLIFVIINYDLWWFMILLFHHQKYDKSLFDFKCWKIMIGSFPIIKYLIH